MTKNIIFDFGNVLVQWHPELVYGQYFGDEAKAWWFLRHIADNDWRLRIDAGESTDVCIRELKGKYPDYEAAIELYRSHWREMLTDEMPGMRELLEELLGHTPQSAKADSSPNFAPLRSQAMPPSEPGRGEQPKYQLYGLTNWSMETFPAAREHFGILQLIHRYVVSGAEGFVKPDPRLFQILLDRFQLKAEECTFVDDNPDNVASANRMGFHGIIFTGADNLRKQLGL